jgi:hypothetical protein
MAGVKYRLENRPAIHSIEGGTMTAPLRCSIRCSIRLAAALALPALSAAAQTAAPGFDPTFLSAPPATAASGCVADACVLRRPDAVPTASLASDLYRKAPEPSPALRVGTSNPQRDWKDNMVRDEHEDNDFCLLGFSLGGDLDLKGFKGIRLFGASHTVQRPTGKEAR